VSAQPYELPSTRTAVVGELAKLPAFFRRDLRIALTYRMGYVTDWLGLLVQVALFYFIGKLVDPSVLPSYGGKPTSYMEFVIVGIALGGFIQLALHRVSAGFRNEQLVGTLESLLVTPTTPTTIQLGTVFYDLLFIPVRTTMFLVITTLAFGLDLRPAGIAPALLVLLAFIPFVWGLGVANAGLVLTFRRGTAILGFGASTLTLLSGAFFPLTVLPFWLAALARFNPLAIALDAMRETLLGQAGYDRALVAVGEIVPFSAFSLALGLWVFGLALRRERRMGTLGLY
jgi:ABC-2 type transport system permease protein